MRDDVLIDSETRLMTDFVNLKIKPAQSSKCGHRDRVCVRVFIRMSTHTCMSIYIYTVFLKKYVAERGSVFTASTPLQCRQFILYLYKYDKHPK
jgi:hypothetical protein